MSIVRVTGIAGMGAKTRRVLGFGDIRIVVGGTREISVASQAMVKNAQAITK